MSDILEKCVVCRALLDEEDLFCPNCGTEAPQRADAQQPLPVHLLTHNFLCQGCGASMSYDASARTLRCPFCGSERMDQQQDARVLSADQVVPFAVDHAAATSLLRKWLGKGFWRPGDLAASSVVTKMTPVFVPYWVFQARTWTYWTADTSATPAGARGDWFPLFGEHRGRYAGLLIGASGALTPAETDGLCPFDLSAAQPYESVDTDNIVVEQFRVQRKYARPSAHQALEDLERTACQAYVPGRCRNLKVNAKLEGLSSATILLPVWIMAYRYQNQVYRFLVNGQTGRATGQAPVSWKKVFAAIAVVVLLAFVLFLILLGMAAV
jgi:predicted RNA-binding Zn-ribbon protein involved in translation (DUF1610 family)